MLYKYCGACRQLKSVDEFSKNRRSNDGYSYACRECGKKRYKNMYQKRKLLKGGNIESI